MKDDVLRQMLWNEIELLYKTVEDLGIENVQAVPLNPEINFLEIYQEIKAELNIDLLDFRDHVIFIEVVWNHKSEPESRARCGTEELFRYLMNYLNKNNIASSVLDQNYISDGIGGMRNATILIEGKGKNLQFLNNIRGNYISLFDLVPGLNKTSVSQETKITVLPRITSIDYPLGVEDIKIDRYIQSHMPMSVSKTKHIQITHHATGFQVALKADNSAIKPDIEILSEDVVRSHVFYLQLKKEQSKRPATIIDFKRGSIFVGATENAICRFKDKLELYDHLDRLIFGQVFN